MSNPSPSRREAIAAHEGGIAAVFPIHDPRALLRAHGLLPVEVWGPPGRDTTSGDAHLQPYACSIVRCGLSFLLDGGLEPADVLVVPHACDSLQGLASVLLDFVRPRAPVLPFYLPRGEGEAATEFLASELRAMAGALAEATGRRPTDDELHACIDCEQEADDALAEMFLSRPDRPSPNREFYEIVRSREYLPSERFVELEREVGGSGDGTPVLLSGLVPEPMTVLDALDEAGLTVVADDLACAGRRLYRPSQRADPFERMAESLLSAPPDSTRGSSVQARLEHLRGLAEASGARAVIFFDIKFCEPELFYLPQLRAGLEEGGLSTLALEVDIADTLPDQLVTRLEAYAESLS